VDARYVTLAALQSLARAGSVKPDVARKAIKQLDINPEKANPTAV
jgi:pyruvate dehydrogenase E1 component